MFDIITKDEYWSWLDAGHGDVRNSTLKGIQDAYILSRLSKLEGMRICEIGRGNATVIDHLSKKNECWLIEKFQSDGAEPSVLTVDRPYRLLEACIGDFDPGVPDEYFDYVYSTSVLEHIPKNGLDAFLRDTIRILKPGGTVLHAMGLYLFDDEDTRRKYAESQGAPVSNILELLMDTKYAGNFVVPPAIDAMTNFSCRYASHSDATMAQLTRVSPELAQLRRCAKRVCVKIEWRKATGGNDAPLGGKRGQARIEHACVGTIDMLYNYHATNVLKPWLEEGGNHKHLWSLKGLGYAYVCSRIAAAHASRGGMGPLKILDVGGGYSRLGSMITRLYNADYSVADDFGIESNEKKWSRHGNREELVARNPEIKYEFVRMGTHQSKCLHDNAYDVVLSVSALEHVPESQWLVVLDDMFRLLKKTGGIFISSLDITQKDLVKWSIFLEAYFTELSGGNCIDWQRIRENFSGENTLYETPEIVYTGYPPANKPKKYVRRCSLLISAVTGHVNRAG